MTANTPDIVAMSQPEWLIWLSGYRSGLHDGHQAEADAMERMEAAAYARAVSIVHRAANLPEVPPDRQVPRHWTDRGAP